MEKSKLILLLRTFSNKEWKLFSDFIRSPFFNKNEELIYFFDYLKKISSKGLPDIQVKREVIWRQLFPRKKYSEKLLNHYMSQLYQLGERFLQIQAFESKKQLTDFYLLEACIERRLEKSYQHANQRALKRLEQNPYRDEHYFYQRFLMAEVGDQHFMQKKVREADSNLKETAEYFDRYFLLKKLKLLCTILDRQRFLAMDYDLRWVEEIQQHFQKHDYADDPAIMVYYTLFQALTQPEEAHYFHDLKAHISIAEKVLPPATTKDLLYFAINYCIRKIRLGEKQYANDLMSLYQQGLLNKALLEDGFISPWTYKNMVKLALGLKQFEWVEDFVETYSSKLNEKTKEDAYHFNLADLYYHKKDYDRALSHLNQVEFSDIIYNIDAKAMLLKIYFETNAEEAFLSLTFSYKMFIKRNKLISKNIRDAHLNFINILYQIFKYKDQRFEQLKEKIENTPALNGRNWLRQQLGGKA